MSNEERRHVKNKWFLIKGGAVKGEKTCEWLLLIGGVLTVRRSSCLHGQNNFSHHMLPSMTKREIVASMVLSWTFTLLSLLFFTVPD